MSLRAIVVNIATGYAGNLALLAAGILTKVVLARLLAPGDFGALISAQTLFGFAAFVATLGLTDAVVRRIAIGAAGGHGRPVGTIRSALMLAMPASVVAALVTGLGGSWGGRWMAPGHELLFAALLVVMSAGLPFKTAADIFGAANQGSGRYWAKVLYVDILPAMVVLTVVSLLLLFDSGDARMVAAAYLLAMATAAALIVGSSREMLAGARAAPEAGNSRGALLRFALPLLASGIVAWPLGLVPVVLGSALSAESVAYYSLALSLASFIYLGTSVSEAASYGAWSAHVGKKQSVALIENYRTVTRWGFLASSLIFAPLLFCAQEVVAIVYGARYAAAADLLQLFAVVFFLNTATGPNESILKALGCSKWILFTRLAVGVTVAASLFPLLHAFGLHGAVVSYAATVLVGMAMYAGYLAVRHGIGPIDAWLLRGAAAVVLALLLEAALVSQLPAGWNAATRVACVCASYAALLVALLHLTRAIAAVDRAAWAKLAVGLRAMRG